MLQKESVEVRVSIYVQKTRELTVVKLSVQSVGGGLDEGVGDATELRVVNVAVDGVGSALLGEEKEFLEQHCV